MIKKYNIQVKEDPLYEVRVAMERLAKRNGEVSRVRLK